MSSPMPTSSVSSFLKIFFIDLFVFVVVRLFLAFKMPISSFLHPRQLRNGSLLAVQILRPDLGLTESGAVGRGSAICVATCPPGDSEGH